jgi:hypothetical protein
MVSNAKMDSSSSLPNESPLENPERSDGFGQEEPVGLQYNDLHQHAPSVTNWLHRDQNARGRKVHVEGESIFPISISSSKERREIKSGSSSRTSSVSKAKNHWPYSSDG